MVSTSAIATHQLTKQYGDKTVVDHLNLSVAEGRIACLLGPNGSGKTTTVGMLTTLRNPTSGRAIVCGVDVLSEPARVRALTGVTLQDTGVDDLMTGREILELQGVLQGLRLSATRRRASELIDLLDLGTHADTRLATWSGGLRRRIALATALVHCPRVLFLDEPTTGLDPASRRDLWNEIRRLNHGEGVTVLLTTQYLEEADQLADDVSILHNGRLLITAAPEALKEDLGDWTLTLVLVNAAAADRARDILGTIGTIEMPEPDTLRITVDRDGPARCLTELTRAGLEVTSMQVAEPSLEDVFLQLTTS